MTAWAASVCGGIADALRLLDSAVTECPAALWDVPMWRVLSSEITVEVRDVGGSPVTEPARREALIQRWSTPWSVAWHALEVLDYDLAGELETWAPPPPFAGHPHWQSFTTLREPWSQPAIGAYIEHCQGRVRETFAEMTDDRAATPLPSAHRYAGRPYAWLLTSLIGHTTAHAIQIRQFGSSRP